jgi:hypothetical protein
VDNLDLCLYCETPIGPGSTKRSVAHAIPSALGGRMKSERICCATCNTDTSKSERVLCEDLRAITGAFGVIRGDGDLAPPVIVDLPGRGKMTLSRGMLNAKGVQRTLSERDGHPHLEARVSDLMKAVDVAAHSVRATGRSAEDIGKRVLITVNAAPRVKLDAGDFPIRFGGPSQSRAVSKMALEVLAFHRPKLARRSELADLRQWVRHGKGSVDIMLDLWTPSFNIAEFTEMAHAVEVASMGPYLLGRVVLFGELHFTLTMSALWSAHPIACGYSVDPLTGADLFRRSYDLELPPQRHWRDRRNATKE